LSEPVDLKVVAECAGVSVGDIKALNPELMLGTTPPDAQSYRLRLPQGYSDVFQAAYAALPPERRTGGYEYIIQKGDTIRKIARRFGTTPEAILSVNALRNARSLRVGARLLLPLSGASSREVAGATGDTIFHAVRKGENLRKISHQYGITIDHLAALNGLNPKRYKIYPGDRLIVQQMSPPEPQHTASPSSSDSEPKPPVIYTVKRGDTLWSIAKAFSIDVDQIAEWNGIRRSSRLKEGHQLKIWSFK
ncbi:MAG: LysM peptidoglycan-binding domain-containing protein, partial [Candidatus Latescibacteria bacterium]|nr:LysM peptidoglycan-binding domain-containing protein [Candidatus Latescibacterota bacterium]